MPHRAITDSEIENCFTVMAEWRPHLVERDSGIQRSQAHKFYFAQGFTIAGYHFTEALTK